MKRLLAYLFIVLGLGMLCCNISFAAKINPYKVGDIVENQLTLGKKYKVPLPPGKFEVVVTNLKQGFHDIMLFQADKNGATRWQIQIWVSKKAQYWWNPPKFCKRKDLYFNKSKLGNRKFHCWIINHTRSELSSGKGFWGKVRDWIIAERIIQPDIYVYSQHEYQTSDKRLIGMGYFYNPEVDGVPAPKNIDWETAEYHMSRVHKYPEHEAFLKKFISVSATLVKRFNELNNVKGGLSLNPNQYITQSSINTETPENKVTNDSSEDIISKLKSLKDLLDAGAITQEEFEKAKKKILN